MSKKGSLTILVVLADQLLRADLDRGTVTPLIYRTARAADDDFGADVKAAIAAGKGSVSRVLILSEECWRQTIRLATAQVHGLNEEEIAQALQFEAEPFSNMAPQESMAGYVEISAGIGGKSFFMVEMPNSAVVAAQAEVRKAGGRLIGITHPALAEADRSNTEARLPDFDDEHSLQTWLLLWAGSIEGERDSVALIVPPPIVASTQKLVAFGVVLWILATLICFGISSVVKKQNFSLKNKLATLKAVDAQIAQGERDCSAISANIEELKQKKQAHEEAFSLIQNRRKALLEMLRTLAEERPENLVIQSIQDDGGWSMQIAGLAVTTDAPDHLMAKMSELLADRGWNIQPQLKQVQGGYGDGGAWKFVIKADLADKLDEIVKKTTPPVQIIEEYYY